MSSPLVAVLESLEACPLLGTGRRQALQYLSQAAILVVSQPDPEHEYRLVAAGALMSLADQASGSVGQLLEAAQAAGRAQDFEGELQLRLAAVRGLVLNHRLPAARALLSELVASASAIPRLEPDWRLAAAACEVGDVRRHLERCIATLPSPSRDHDRIRVHMELAQRFRDGGGEIAAITQLRSALALTRKYAAPVLSCQLETFLGQALLEAGQLPAAQQHLTNAVDLAIELDDTLTLCSTASLLAALQIAQGDWAAARRNSQLLLDASQQRQNWMGVADGAISLSTCSLKEGDLDTTLRILVTHLTALMSRGARAAANLLIARLSEIRAEHDSHDFDHRIAGLVADVKES